MSCRLPGGVRGQTPPGFAAVSDWIQTLVFTPETRDCIVDRDIVDSKVLSLLRKPATVDDDVDFCYHVGPIRCTD
jgi:hypothetical protein